LFAFESRGLSDLDVMLCLLKNYDLTAFRVS
jgi:hypothetical protein